MAGKKGMKWGLKIISPTNIEQLRASIEAEKLIDALRDHVLGAKEMLPTQVTAALGLIRKVLPDKAETEHTGESTINHVISGEDARRDILGRLTARTPGNGEDKAHPRAIQ